MRTFMSSILLWFIIFLGSFLVTFFIFFFVFSMSHWTHLALTVHLVHDSSLPFRFPNLLIKTVWNLEIPSRGSANLSESFFYFLSQGSTSSIVNLENFSVSGFRFSSINFTMSLMDSTPMSLIFMPLAKECLTSEPIVSSKKA